MCHDRVRVDLYPAVWLSSLTMPHLGRALMGSVSLRQYELVYDIFAQVPRIFASIVSQEFTWYFSS